MNRGSAYTAGGAHLQARIQELEFLDAAVFSVSTIHRDGAVDKDGATHKKGAAGESVPGGLRDQVGITVCTGEQ